MFHYLVGVPEIFRFDNLSSTVKNYGQKAKETSKNPMNDLFYIKALKNEKLVSPWLLTEAYAFSWLFCNFSK